MNVVILAAGMGKRMRSQLPKVLHRIAGVPMLGHVVATVRTLPVTRIVIVVGHGGDQVRAAMDASTATVEIRFAVQEPQLGTGHAVQQAVPLLDDSMLTAILYGDVPLIGADTLRRLSTMAAVGSTPSLALLTVMLDDPTGYGRIVRGADQATIEAIVEQKDASPAQRAIREVNSGIMVAPTVALKDWLSRLTNDNAQREYYLTDIVALARQDGVAVVATQPSAVWETSGVNDRAQLAELERRFQRTRADDLMAAGVTLADPARIDVRGTLVCGPDVSIDVGCVFEGDVTIGAGATIGPYAVIRNARIGERVRVEPYCHIDGGPHAADAVEIGGDAVIGPYARLRPGARLADQVHVGNFVEVKNSRLGTGSKANHLSYVGDAVVGANVNIGAGTITCNYDGAAKHVTTIEDDVHIGSDVQLVAPVTVGRGATVGAGTTVWKDVPPGTLALNPKTQTARVDWTRPKKK